MWPVCTYFEHAIKLPETAGMVFGTCTLKCEHGGKVSGGCLEWAAKEVRFIIPPASIGNVSSPGPLACACMWGDSCWVLAWCCPPLCSCCKWCAGCSCCAGSSWRAGSKMAAAFAGCLPSSAACRDRVCKCCPQVPGVPAPTPLRESWAVP